MHATSVRNYIAILARFKICETQDSFSGWFETNTRSHTLKAGFLLTLPKDKYAHKEILLNSLHAFLGAVCCFFKKLTFSKN